MTQPYIARLLDCPVGDTLFAAAPRRAPDRLLDSLRERFGAIDPQLLRRLASNESAAAMQLAEAAMTEINPPEA